MTSRVFITIDTEEDSWDNRSRDENPVENISRIHLVQELFDGYGVVPTYFVNYPVVKDPVASGILAGIHETGRCEIGAHCHPWNTPPFVENLSNRNSMLSNLPRQLVYDKITSLHEAIVERFDLEPVSFRAGRWGFSSDVAACLGDLGYLVDSSVMPLWNWTADDGPDFSRAPSGSFRFSPGNILEEDPSGPLLEVPVTIGFLQGNFRRSASLRKTIIGSPLARLRLLGLLDRLNILNIRLLSPETCSAPDMIRASKSFIGAGFGFLNMMFHTTSLLPGKSEFVRDETDLRIFIEKIRSFIEFCLSEQLIFCPIREALKMEAPRGDAP